MERQTDREETNRGLVSSSQFQWTCSHPTRNGEVSMNIWARDRPPRSQWLGLMPAAEGLMPPYWRPVESQSDYQVTKIKLAFAFFLHALAKTVQFSSFMMRDNINTCTQRERDRVHNLIGMKWKYFCHLCNFLVDHCFRRWDFKENDITYLVLNLQICVKSTMTNKRGCSRCSCLTDTALSHAHSPHLTDGRSILDRSNQSRQSRNNTAFSGIAEPAAMLINVLNIWYDVIWYASFPGGNCKHFWQICASPQIHLLL